MTQDERLKWLDQIVRHPGLTPKAMVVAYWLSGRFVDGLPLNLSDAERENVGHRKTMQRGLAVLEWAGYIKVDRRSRRPEDDQQFRLNRYEFLFPDKVRKVPCGAYNFSPSLTR